MNVYKYQDVVADPATGRPVSGVSITVRMHGSETLATLYNEAGTVEQPNPVYTDSLGFFSFWVPVGTYDLICSYGTEQANRMGVFIDGVAGMIGYSTKAVMDADLSPPEGVVGLVTNDADFANNTFYRKVGVSGSGSWTKSSGIFPGVYMDGTVTHVYAFGDSLTANGTYESTLNSALGDSWEVHNKGVSGNTTIQMGARLGDILDPPDGAYVIVMGGTNDLSANATDPTNYNETEIKNNLQAIYTAAHNQGLTVIAMTIPPKGAAAPQQTILQNVNTWILNTATNVDFRIDTYTLLNDPGNPGHLLAAYDSGDHTHLSTAGYTALGNYIYGQVTWATAPPAASVMVSGPAAINQGVRVEDTPKFQAVRIPLSSHVDGAYMPRGVSFEDGAGDDAFQLYLRANGVQPSIMTLVLFCRALGVDLIQIDNSGAFKLALPIQPMTDNATDIGKAGVRYRDIEIARNFVAGNGVIVWGAQGLMAGSDNTSEIGSLTSKFKNIFGYTGYFSSLVVDWVPGKVGSNVASASTITPSGQIFHVTGTAAIDNISVPQSGNFTGSITIIPDGAFTTTTAGSGNSKIAKATTAVVGQALTMTTDGSMWYPSY